MRNLQALKRKPKFRYACLEVKWMCHFQVKLDERERPSCVTEGEVSCSLEFKGTG